MGCLNKQRGGGAAQGDSRFGSKGTFRGTGQNSGRYGEDNDEEERRVKGGKES